MAEFSLKPIIMFFVVVILGVVFLGQIEDNVAATEVITTLSNNESLTWAGNNTAITLANDDLVSGSETLYNNGTKVNRGSGVAANYTITSSTITILNSSGGPVGITGADWATSELNLTYTHEGDLFVANTTARTLLGIIGIFFVLTIFAFGIKALRESSDDFNFGFGKVK